MLYINSSYIQEKYKNRSIYIFGTGMVANMLWQKITDVRILAFVDNYRKNQKMNDCRIISVDELIHEWKGEPVIIASIKFASDIAEQLKSKKLKEGEDFFIFDEENLFTKSDAVQKFISFNEKVWRRYQREGTKKVLIPCRVLRNSDIILHAYFANFFAEKYEAEIYAYPKGTWSVKNCPPLLRDVYKSINVKGFIDRELQFDYEREAAEILEEIWGSIHSWEDWKHIVIYGIDFGTTMIRHYLREFVPPFRSDDKIMFSFLADVIKTIVFWYHYFKEHEVCALILADGVTWDGYLRDLALSLGILVYIVDYPANIRKPFLGFYHENFYQYYKCFWNLLSKEEQEYGIQWAKKHLELRLKGCTDEIPYMKDKSVYANYGMQTTVLRPSNKIKVLICPHIFEEDCYCCGEQVFANNYWYWLCHLGDLSSQLPQYDWYIKMHPNGSLRDNIIIDNLLEHYPNITKIPTFVSPIKLKEEGIQYALTVYGTIGHEYPAFGIQVINAGNNPYSSFDFTWNPKDKKSYDELIYNLGNLKPKENLDQLYQFYCIHYLYYNRNKADFYNVFFKTEFLKRDIRAEPFSENDYIAYMEQWTSQNHEVIMKAIPDILNQVDAWRPDIFYKNKVLIEK